MESKKINYKKPAMQVVEIQYQGHLLNGTGGNHPQDPIPGNARENRDNWGSTD